MCADGFQNVLLSHCLKNQAQIFCLFQQNYSQNYPVKRPTVDFDPNRKPPLTLKLSLESRL
jgi:hypothetical protein